jgi:hypothetical protein
VEAVRVMKKLITLALILLSPLVVAQEKQVWACQQVAGALLDWEGSSWNRYGVTSRPLLLTIDGANSSVNKGDRDRDFNCRTALIGYPELSCLDTTGSAHVWFNPENGKMGTSDLFGATESGGTRDTVSVIIYNCTKF